MYDKYKENKNIYIYIPSMAYPITVPMKNIGNIFSTLETWWPRNVKNNPTKKQTAEINLKTPSAENNDTIERLILSETLLYIYIREKHDLYHNSYVSNNDMLNWTYTSILKNELIMFSLSYGWKWNTYIKCRMIQDRSWDYSRTKLWGHRQQNDSHN